MLQILITPLHGGDFVRHLSSALRGARTKHTSIIGADLTRVSRPTICGPVRFGRTVRPQLALTNAQTHTERRPREQDLRVHPVAICPPPICGCGLFCSSVCERALDLRRWFSFCGAIVRACCCEVSAHCAVADAHNARPPDRIGPERLTCTSRANNRKQQTHTSTHTPGQPGALLWSIVRSCGADVGRHSPPPFTTVGHANGAQKEHHRGPARENAIHSEWHTHAQSNTRWHHILCVCAVGRSRRPLTKTFVRACVRATQMRACADAIACERILEGY